MGSLTCKSEGISTAARGAARSRPPEGSETASSAGPPGRAMAPSFRPGKGRPPRGDEDCAEARADRKVSRRGAAAGGRAGGRRADGAVVPADEEAAGGEEAPGADQREPAGAAAAAGRQRGEAAGRGPGWAAGPGAVLTAAAAPGQFQAKLENAEVLELTVRRVQAVLERRSLGECRRRGGGGGRPGPRLTPLPSLSPAVQRAGGCTARPASASLPATSSACTRCTPSSPAAPALTPPPLLSCSTTCWSPCRSTRAAPRT